MSYLWLIPVLPAIGFVVNGLFGLWTRWRTGGSPPRAFVYWVGCSSVFLSFVLSVVCFFQLLGLDSHSYKQTLFTWIPGNMVQTDLGEPAQFLIEWSLLLDPLSAVMILFVSGIGFLIHVYSIGYMWEDDGFYRFFAYLNLFMFMMLTLVLGANYLVLFVGWEGVGLCSYLLIGFYLNRRSAGDAAKKAFVVNRIGDMGFVLGMMFLFAYFGTLDFTTLFAEIERLFPEPEMAWGALSWIGLLLFIGACGKSAQIPLYIWLPDAMEGPTPVSALIHAATMVTAGVYMVARSTAIYSRAPEALLTVAVIGAFTALVAASIGLFQRDIKRVLAYSTVSQLGYMFAALGVGAAVAGIFHVFTHAFFKALLFLGAGSVIHAVHHEQDMMKMGGLRKYMPVTFITMLIGTLAIAGVPPLAGFFSKDEILWKLFSSGHWILWLLGVLAAVMTAYYMFRLMFLTFWGEERMDDHTRSHVHESPRSMTWPLILLAGGSAVVGFLGLPPWTGLSNTFEHFLEPAFASAYHGAEAHGPHSLALEVGLALFSVAVAAAGIGLAYLFFIKDWDGFAALRERLQPLRQAIYDKYYVDEAYDLLFVNRTKDTGNAFTWFDTYVVDGLVNGSALMTRITAWLSGQADLQIVDRIVNLLGETVSFFSGIFRRLQTGLMQSYALFFVVGILVLITVYLYRGAF